jgi:hypothetical protein
MSLARFPIYGSIFLACLSISGCKSEIDKFKPEDYFTESQKKSILMQLVLKTSDKPSGNLTASEIEAYYQQEAFTCTWHFVHEKNGSFFFFVSHPAPSLYDKRAGIGGKFKTDDYLHIKGFKEVFRTFKMKPSVLQKKGGVLFEKMVNGQDLSPYYPNRNSDKDEWIEFPDQLNYYDSLSQSWKMRLILN